MRLLLPTALSIFISLAFVVNAHSNNVPDQSAQMDLKLEELLDRFEFITVSYGKDWLATVDTIIVRNDTDMHIPISFRMHKTDNNWLAYDFMVEHLSLVQSYRTEYQAHIKNNGIDGLLTYMENEINQ